MRYNITPVSKPRQTQSDKWKKRPCVVKYRSFADRCRELGVEVPECGGIIIFGLPMPKSWSKKKRDDMIGKPRQQRPDKDNLEKALLDAVYGEDCVVWDSHSVKIWAKDGFIEVIKGETFKAEL